MRTHFQQDALPRFQYLPFVFVDINDLRMRINLQHPGCFRLAAIGVKRFFIECLTPHSARAILDRIPDYAGVLVWMGSTNVPNFSLIG